MLDLENAFHAADAAGDKQAAAQLADEIVRLHAQMNKNPLVHQTSGTTVDSVPPPVESAAFKQGRGMGGASQATLKLADVLGFGLPKKFMTPEQADMTRGAMAQFKQDMPVANVGVDLAGNALGAAAGGVGVPVVQGAARVLPAIGRAAASGAVSGGLSAAGESNAQTGGDLVRDIAMGAGMGAGMGGGMAGVGAGGAGIVRNIAARTTNRGAASDAQRELIKALSRDLPYGEQLDPGKLTQAQQLLQQLGPEARLVDLGKDSTRKLADILATLPGKAPAAMEEAIASRQAGRAGRLMTAADAALGTQGKGYTATLGELEAQKIADSTPFYDQLKNVQVPADDDLLTLLRRAGKESLGKAQRLSRLAGEDQVSVGAALQETRDAVTNAATPGKPISFQSLDHVKQALYDLETKFKIGGEPQEAAAFGKLRRELTDKLDDLSPKDQAGASIYAQARNAYAGPAQMKDALEAGRSALTLKPVELEDAVKGMGSSEVDAFRVGVLQSLREKTGTESGQTSLLKMWKEPGTSDRLKLVFGNDFTAFENAVDNERRLKLFESVGRGSGTASRMAQAGDLGMAGDAARAVGAAKTGNIEAVIGAGLNAANRAALPEKTRNQLAQMLLSQGGDAATNLAALNQALLSMNRRRATGTALAAALGNTANQATGTELAAELGNTANR
jgi:hypothetical protein